MSDEFDAKTQIRDGEEPGTAKDAEAALASAPTNIRSHIEDDDSDKTVVIGGGVSSSSDATVVLGAGDVPQSGAPTLTLGNTKVINDRFELLDVLGSGGMGVVFKALDRRKVEAKDRDPYVAIKLLNDDFKVHPHSVISLQREARRSQKLAHPNIVNVHDFDRDGDQVFMTMECLQGKPLDELIKANGNKPLEMEAAHRIVKDMTAAMIHAHKNNIAHSDFKPGNIFVTDAGQGKVLDFGIARAVTSGLGDEKSGNENTLFDPGSLGALTPAYASREMLTGQLPEIGDDVYAMGCVAYELFTGHHPFKKKNAVDAKKAGMRPARIKSLSARQWKALRKALAFKREDRYASATDFWEDFDRHVSPIWWVAALVVVIAGGAAVWSVEQRSQFEAVDEDAIRLQADQDNAYSNLQAWIAREPVSSVEADIRAAYETYQGMVGEADEKLLASRKTIVDLYIKEAGNLRLEKKLELAQSTLAAALTWDADAGQREDYLSLNAGIVQDIEAERQRLMAEQKERERQAELAQAQADKAERARRLQEQRAVAEAEAKAREESYQRSLAAVESVLSCQAFPDFDALTTQLDNMRTLDEARYQQKMPAFSERMAICIKRIGSSNPVAGKAAQTSALAVFPNSPLLKDIVIDPCASSKLGPGSGRRDGKFCYDSLSGSVNGPKMVVVPGVDGGASYAVGKYEVTAKDFGAYCKAGNDCAGITDTQSDLPVRQLSVAQANAYAQWLSSESGFSYRLPTYTEWLNAAVATGRKKNLDPNCTVKRVNGTRGGDELRVAGGAFNDWGLYNVIGNVQEWATDGGSLLAAGGQHTDRLADTACSVEAKVSHSGSPDKTTGFRLVRKIER
ncbi:protein kinase domain-containing protein [Oceanicoccus sagamiensis]|uniref:Protein kinase domain-containing protein n=1 Tax=Oceanicoccus sagamiensis TaxID=716816 RepID=A0A1X9N8Q3_9GAMM|nr:protein kinase [Oceanicoccus sagamiensis]ARN74448.1 hypothetical protein BST96_10180 [Oceanicoccus sagamiensis]